MDDKRDEHTLEFLLNFDGRIHWLEKGYRLKFEIRRIKATRQRPHGLRYSFTLHGPNGRRLLGFDNAHAATSRKGTRRSQSPVAYDHWHRTEHDAGRPYEFVNADVLLRDFFAEVRRVLNEHGVSDEVVTTTVKDKGQKS